MYTMTLQDPVGSQYRDQGDEQRAKDRRAAILFGSPLASRQRHTTQIRWSTAEKWALENDLFIGEPVSEDPKDSNRPLLERQAVRRLLLLCVPGPALPGGVLVPRLDDLGDALSKAALAGYWVKHHFSVTFWTTRKGRPHVLTERMAEKWAQAHGAGLGPVAALVAECESAAQAAAIEEICGSAPGSDSPTDWPRLGRGPLRNVELAAQEARERRSCGWSDERIREYLNLYGFANRAGTVGRWYPIELKAVLVGDFR